MKNQFTDVQDENVQNANLATDVPLKNGIGLPVIALALDLTPVFLVFLSSLISFPAILSELFLLGMVLSPVAGIIAGVMSLSRGKKQIGTVGVVLAVIATALPPVFIITIILLFKTGAVVIGM